MTREAVSIRTGRLFEQTVKCRGRKNLRETAEMARRLPFEDA